MSDLPRTHDGIIDLPRCAAQTSLQLHHIYEALAGTACLQRDIRELLPARGELRDLHDDLLARMINIERAFQDADDTLMTIAQLMSIEARSTHDNEPEP